MNPLLNTIALAMPSWMESIKSIEKDMTQAQLAEAVGVSRQTMSAIEKGDYNPTIKLCIAICKVLNKTLDELFGGIDYE